MYYITALDGYTNVVEAEVDAGTMTDPSGLPSAWPAGSIIYTAGYAAVKQKGLDGTWTEVE